RAGPARSSSRQRSSPPARRGPGRAGRRGGPRAVRRPGRRPGTAAAGRGSGRAGGAHPGPSGAGPAGRLPAVAGPPARPPPGRAGARDALLTLLGAGQAAIGVWEALDQAGLITRLLPDWEKVRNRPQRNPLHTFTVDRHLVETAAQAAALTRSVARPDLLLITALLHDIGKGWPGDHLLTGEVVARDTAHLLGFGAGGGDPGAPAGRPQAP